MTGGPHPLDPVTADEVTRAVRVARSLPDLSDDVKVVSVETREPEKTAYLAWKEGGVRPARETFCILLDRGRRRGVEVVVSLDDDSLVSAVLLPEGVQPAMHLDEFVRVVDAVRSDERYLAALRLRGVDPASVHVEPWSTGTFEPGTARQARALTWVRADDKGDNPYSRPLYGLVAVIDLDRMIVTRIDDHAPGTRPPTGEGGDYRAGGGHPYRSDLRPLQITQPEGPSFVLDGHHVAWQKWDLRVGLHPREGLTLHDIGYTDAGERRSLCHRASIAELVIPYGDPNPTTHFKGVFDTGEYGMGPLTNSLRLGCDCLGEIAYLDGITNTWDGEARTIPNAICIHEEDDNLLWKHTDDYSGRVDRARSRRLVISSIATVGNYEYGYFWYLHLDGSLRFEAKLTGIVHTAGWVSSERSPYSLPLGDGIVTSNHQHFLCARLDLDLDGTRNTAFEVDSVAEPRGPANPDGVAFRTERLTYARESQARRSVAPASARRFRVENRSRRNRIGDPVSYELVPGDNMLPLQDPGSSIRERARFLDHHLWVTRYDPAERYPAGEYPTQSAGGDGLPAWAAADRPLLDEDVVVWYVFGAHHVPRLEDWPVMPVSRTGFELRPVGFFDFNPALDVPPPEPGTHCCPAEAS
ncbi:MAG: primary-amine oxidase [Thermoleophilia bacterium]|nr:primary-amine oxidase [Thermoleophilia bacterium]